jgi:hypothetical protein
MTDEQNERLNQIREAAKWGESSEIAAIRARAYNSIQFSADTYMFDVRRLLHLYPQLRDVTATSMRSACIEKVKEFFKYSPATCEAIINALETVTIQEQEKL